MSPIPAYIDASELAGLVLDPKKTSGRDYIVIDARDTDFVGGHIPGAVNVPAHKLDDRVGGLIDKYQGVPLVVFHCAWSQIRGPKSARKYLGAVHERLKTVPLNGPLHNQQVKVLRGGFNSWYRQYALATPPRWELIEGYDKKEWMGQDREI
ncbi:Cdc25 phosphatase Ibp1 [Coemansia furcata]|nr:Cdc25 phosphatase Ibp1 [Coemansia furcata]